MASDIVTNYNIKYPFISDKDLLEIVDFYSDFSKSDFLNKLIHKRREEVPHEDIFEKNNNDLYVYLFNTWKNNLLNISYEDVKSEKYDVTFEIMPVINYLKRIPDAKSIDDVVKYLNPKDNEVKLFLSKYSFVSNMDSFWPIFESKGLTAVNNNLSADGFLTLNIKRYDVPKFSKIFTRVCLEQNIPFSYKFNASGNINDNFIINYDNRYLNDYIRIIRDIFSKFPNLASRVGKTSYLVGSTNDNIGIGIGNYTDYYSKRVNHVDECISDVSTYFIVNNLSKKIKIDNEKLSIISYLSHELAVIVSEKQSRYAIDNNSFSNFVKYRSNDYIKKLEVAIKKEIQLRLAAGFSAGDIVVNFDNSDLTIPGEIFNNVLRKATKSVFRCYPHLYDMVKQYIIYSAESNGINSDYRTNLEDTSSKNVLKKQRV